MRRTAELWRKTSLAAAGAGLLLPSLLLAAQGGGDPAEPAAEAADEPVMEIPAYTPDFHWTDIGQWILWIWNMPVLRIDQADVLVSQIIFALLIMVVGVTVARRITRAVRNRLVARTPLDTSAAAAVEKLLFYLMLVLIFLTALQTVSIPIAMFAFLGGAIAIGVGFGAQNIFGNFISGFILMLDRPIRIGDTVEVGEHYGRIAEIGGRCTRLRRFDGIDVLVPNTALIENSVVNWTLADKQVRQTVRVGIAYGSDVVEAAALLRQAVEERPEVLKRGEPPRVIFEDFGDSALIFDVYYWLELSDLVNMRTIRSAIRFRVNELYNDAGIVIAYPQRDLHIDTLAPIDVRVLESSETTAAS